MKDQTSSIRRRMKGTPFHEHSSPIFMTSSFVYDSAEHAERMFAGEDEGYIYSRFSNPNCTELFEKMSRLEKTETGIATASGMAAIFSTLASYLKKGDHILAANSLFGNSLHIIKHILPNWGVNYALVDMTKHKVVESAITKDTKLVLIETPANPGLDIIDIRWLSNLCNDYNAILVVDNCFATPVIQKPVDFGADIIIHSATKWIDGQGRTLGGLVLGPTELIEPVYLFIRRTGACLSPFNAWLLSKSLETLEIRMHKHCENAADLAQFLVDHKGVKKVIYPFLPSHPQYELAKKQMNAGGGIVTCDLEGSKQNVFQFINRLKMLSITANLGDTRTIVTHPATTTHSKLTSAERLEIGITDQTLRFSVGLEHIDDIRDDLDQALSNF